MIVRLCLVVSCIGKTSEPSNEQQQEAMYERPFLRSFVLVGDELKRPRLLTDKEDESTDVGNVIGAVVSFISSVFSNIGMQLQKKAHLNMQNSGTSDSYLSSKIWWGGMGCVMLGALGDFAAIGIANQALVAALGGATTLTCNVLIAYYVLHENLQKSDLIGVLMIITGAVIISVQAPASETYTLEELQELSKAPGFVVFIVVVSLSCLFLMMTIANSEFYKLRKKLTQGFLMPIVRRIDKLSEREEILYDRIIELDARYSWLEKRVEQAFWLRGREKEMGVPPMTLMEEGVMQSAQAGGLGQAALRRKHSGRQLSGRKSSRSAMDGGEHRPYEEDDADGKEYLKWVDAFSYAAVAGVIGAISILLAGLASKTLIMALQGNSQFDKPAPYLFIAGMLCTVILQTKYLNSAMMMGDIMTVYPVFQAFWIGFGVFGGMVYYQESTKLSTANWVAYVIAAVLMVAGCIFFFEHGKREWAVIRRRLLRSHFLKQLKNSGQRNSNSNSNSNSSTEPSTDSPNHRYGVTQSVWPEKAEGEHSDTHSLTATNMTSLTGRTYSDAGTPRSIASGSHGNFGGSTTGSIGGPSSHHQHHHHHHHQQQQQQQQQPRGRLPPLPQLSTIADSRDGTASGSPAPASTTSQRSRGWGKGRGRPKGAHVTVMTLNASRVDPRVLVVESDGCTLHHPAPGAVAGVIQGSLPFDNRREGGGGSSGGARKGRKRSGRGTAAPVGYFEVELLEVGVANRAAGSGSGSESQAESQSQVACVAVGLAHGGYPQDSLPGWNEGSVAYHGDEGRLYWETDTGGHAFGPKLLKGDVVGCGIDLASSRIFFTRNGLFLKEAVVGEWVQQQPYHPTIALGGDGAGGGEVVRVNFGDRPFAYDPRTASV